jgi:hypothetical protein
VASRLSHQSKTPNYEYISADGGRESGPLGKLIEEKGRVYIDQVGTAGKQVAERASR